MENNDFNLLTKALCHYFPHNVKIQVEIPFISEEEYPIETLKKLDLQNYTANDCRIETVKPVLRPLESLTDKEVLVFTGVKGINLPLTYRDLDKLRKSVIEGSTAIVAYLNRYLNKADWLLENKFDCYGLIPLGLAIPATEETYKQ